MSEKHTPITEQVREVYAGAQTKHYLRRLEAFDRWLNQVRAEERERIAQAIVDELARTTATARPEACEYADEGYCHTEAREQALEDAARIARQGGNK